MAGFLACAALLIGAGCAPAELGAQSWARSRGAAPGQTIRLMDGGMLLPPTMPTPDAGQGGKIPDPLTPDAAPPAADAAPPVPAVTPYPSGPWGADRGETLGDHEFAAPDSTPVRWSQLRADPKVKAFVWIISASWCGACREQVPHLNELHQRLASRGVVVVESLFQDVSGGPAAARDAQEWESQLGCEFEVVADTDPAVMPSVTPTARIIDAETMRVIQVFEGDDSSMDSQIETALSASTR